MDTQNLETNELKTLDEAIGFYFSYNLTKPENLDKLWRLANWFRENPQYHEQYMELNNFIVANGYTLFLHPEFPARLSTKIGELLVQIINPEAWAFAYGRKVFDR